MSIIISTANIGHNFNIVPHVHGQFHSGRRMTLKKWYNFFYGETNISIKINIDTKQLICMYQLRFSGGPHDLCLGISLVEIV